MCGGGGGGGREFVKVFKKLYQKPKILWYGLLTYLLLGVCVCVCVCSLLLSNPNFKDPYLLAQVVWVIVK